MPAVRHTQGITGLAHRNTIFIILGGASPILLFFSYDGEALLAGHGLHVLGGDALDVRAVGRFTVAPIARDHPVRIETMQISFLPLLAVAMLSSGISLFGY
jgi:hypothetical protein